MGILLTPVIIIGFYPKKVLDQTTQNVIKYSNYENRRYKQKNALFFKLKIAFGNFKQ